MTTDLLLVATNLYTVDNKVCRKSPFTQNAFEFFRLFWTHRLFIVSCVAGIASLFMSILFYRFVVFYCFHAALLLKEFSSCGTKSELNFECHRENPTPIPPTLSLQSVIIHLLLRLL